MLNFELSCPNDSNEGTPLDLKKAGKSKKISIENSFNGVIEIQMANDVNGPWAPVCTFTSPGDKDISSVARFFRAVRKGVIKPGPADVKLTCSDEGIKTVALSDPGANGPGAQVDISEFGESGTIICHGAFTGAVTVEVTEDGTSWNQVAFFKNAGVKTFEVRGKYLRLRRSGVNVVDAGKVDISFSAVNDELLLDENSGPESVKVASRKVSGSATSEIRLSVKKGEVYKLRGKALSVNKEDFYFVLEFGAFEVKTGGAWFDFLPFDKMGWPAGEITIIKEMIIDLSDISYLSIEGFVVVNGSGSLFKVCTSLKLPESDLTEMSIVSMSEGKPVKNIAPGSGVTLYRIL